MIVKMQKEKDHGIQIRSGKGKGAAREGQQIARAARKLSTLGKGISKVGRGSKGVGGRGLGRAPAASMPRMQKCMAKVRYAKNIPGTSWKQHGYYVEREGAQAEGKKGIGFGNEGDEQSIPKTLDRWQKEGDEQVFKLIISPEFGERMDLRKHAADLIKQMEKDLGTKLEWVAIDHHNTDNPHLHLLVRGRDDKGQKLVISPDYIQAGVRRRSQELATQELGYRTERDAGIALERQVAQHRYTGLDRALEGRLEKTGGREITFELPDSKPLRDDAYMKRLSEIRRCQELEKLGLATKTGAMTWMIDPELQKKLREVAVVKGREQIVAKNRRNLSDPTLPIAHTDLKAPGDAVAGRLVGVGLDPESEREYMLIEGFDGRAHFVTPNQKLLRMRGDDAGDKQLKDGMYVAFEVKEFEKDGERIKYLDIKSDQTMSDDIVKRASEHGHAETAYQPRPGSLADKYKQRQQQLQLQQMTESAVKKAPTKQWGKGKQHEID